MAKESAERTAESALAAAAGAAARARAAMFTSYGLAIDSARSPVWVWALWRPCLVACIFLAILSRFLDRFSTAPPAPWLSSPLVFTLLYCTMLARSAPAPADARRRLEPSRLAAVERWHYALNLHQLLLNGWVCVALPLEVRALGMRAWGNRMDRSPRAYRLAWLIWVVYSNRYAQGLDTAFLLLRDKYVSVLHVFQQLALTWSWFLVCRVACGGDAYFAALMQAAYNVLTYGYFVIKRNKTPTLRAQRRITHALMLVLSVSAAHTLFVLAHGNMPRVLAVVDLLVMGSMLLLFGNFRYHKYLKPFDTVLAGERAALLQRQTSREAASGSPAPPPLAPRSKTDLGPAASRGDGPKLVVSFDSSGWLYLYHFGVCRFLQQHVLPHMPEDRCVFSGSSGGALAATALACGVPIDDLVDEILAVCWPWCRRSPFAMCPAVEYALNKFLADDGDRSDAWQQCSGRLRLLVTRVQLHPPWFLGDVVSNFTSQRLLRSYLRASCHMPLFGGVTPYPVDGRSYFDGLFWASFLVPWRRPTRRDHVLKVSAIGAPTAHLRPPPVPPWWTVMPPATDVLRALYARGYQDTLAAFRDTADGGKGWAARLELAPEVREAIRALPKTADHERAETARVIGAGAALAWQQVLAAGAAMALSAAFLHFFKSSW